MAHSRFNQSGFSLVELLVASTLFLILSLAIFQIVIHAEYMSASMITQVKQNSQARELFEILADGGVVAGGSPTDATQRIAGYHSYKINPWESELKLINRIINLEHPTQPSTIKTSSYPQTFTITCTEAEKPIKHCLNYGSKEIIDGYIDSIKTSSERSLDSRTVEVVFTIIDPYKVPLDDREARYIQEEYSEPYWTIFTLNRDKHWE